MYSGAGTVVLIGQEGTIAVPVFGTAVTAAKHLGGYVQSVNMTERNNTERVPAVGQRASAAQIAKGYDISGSIEYVYQNGKFLAYALGNSAAPTGTYIHTITCTDRLPSFTMGISHNSTINVVRTYAGCKVNQLRISGGLDQPLKVTADILAQTISVAATALAQATDAETDDVLAPQMATLAIGGTPVAQVQNFELSINNNLEYPHQIGHRLAAAGIEKLREIDLRATFNFEDTEGITQYKSFLADAASPYTPVDTTDIVGASTATLTITNGGAAGSTLRSIVINLGVFKIDEYSISTPVDGIVTADISGFITDFGATPITINDGISTAYLAQT